MSVTCDCVPVPRQFGYDNCEPKNPGDTRTSIPAQEYKNDQTITSFDLPLCKTIGNEAFYNSSLEEIDLPSCETIGTDAFRFCRNLKDGTIIDLPSIKTIGAGAFREINQDGGHGNKTVYINISNAERIGEWAFTNSSYLVFLPGGEDLNLPNCTRIDNGAFISTNSNQRIYFKNIYLPKIEIVDNLFYLTPDTVNGNEIHIGPYCQSINTIVYCEDWNYTQVDANHRMIEFLDFYIEAVTPPIITNVFSLFQTFDSDPNKVYEPAHLYVPATSVNAYKSADKWSKYSNVIEAIPS